MPMSTYSLSPRMYAASTSASALSGSALLSSTSSAISVADSSEKWMFAPSLMSRPSVRSSSMDTPKSRAMPAPAAARMSPRGSSPLTRSAVSPRESSRESVVERETTPSRSKMFLNSTESNPSPFTVLVSSLMATPMSPSESPILTGSASMLRSMPMSLCAPSPAP